MRPILDIYEDKADFWAQERAASKFSEKKYMDRVRDRLSAGSEILDLGCGTGAPIAQYFIETGFMVTGVDGSKNMIAKAAKTFPLDEWIVADMRTLVLGRSFAAVLAWDSFFHLSFEEQEKMFPIFRRHLQPGGILLFTSGPERGEAIGDMGGEKLYHASLAPAEYRALFKANGLKEISFTPEDAECGGHTVWLCSRDA